ncbi:Hypothetical predicted protein [Paramuricea clavata]|uniref:Uncharacterized protein n=1 Tax=Paramuricea clavata TaxID=317549 RepID=A0A6S7J3Z7_PARCT|nr:Hypothetical predicted protein [Paramuricea clavata]
MKEDVQEYIYSKLKTQALELIPIKVNEALELVGIDLIGPLPTTAEGYKYITVVEGNSSAPERTEDLLDHETGERIAKSEATRQQVLSNVELAQEKQKIQYEKRKAKGVKTFEIKVGDTVYKRQMKNVSRKGGKMEPGWMCPYRVTEIDNMQRATLVPFKDDKDDPFNDISNTAAPAKGNSKKVKRGRKPNGVWKCTANGNPEELVLTIMEEDYWLTDEHIDHAQWLLSKQFPDSKGLHSVLALESKPPKVQKGDKDFVQILHQSCSTPAHQIWSLSGHQCKDKEVNPIVAFFVAVATSLLNGEDPGSKSYDHSVMRGHLAVCFHCEELAVFPASSSKCVNNDKKEETIEVQYSAIAECHSKMVIS